MSEKNYRVKDLERSVLVECTVDKKVTHKFLVEQVGSALEGRLKITKYKMKSGQCGSISLSPTELMHITDAVATITESVLQGRDAERAFNLVMEHFDLMATATTKREIEDLRDDLHAKLEEL
tara:strand:+ start:870 stop:1235 length:366 start_codon:yes stop_codon:yes gene_type:complete